MASENTMNHHSDNKQLLCANGCGFFGTSSTMNLCSKCYRDHCLNAAQLSTSAKSTVEKSLTRKSPPLTLAVDQTPEDQSTSARSAVEKTSTLAVEEKPEKARNCCGSCKRKLKITASFTCKCGSMYCVSHRFPSDHNCSFDYKAAGEKAIAKANPVIKGVKIQRF